MKRLSMAIAALLMSATVSFAQSDNVKLTESPFVTSLDKLNKYLQLQPSQVTEVNNINTFFIEKQEESLTAGSKRQTAKLHEALYGNLKLMKETLTAEQYKKYLLLINTTVNNKGLQSLVSTPEALLANSGK
jgi:hypothetical protein